MPEKAWIARPEQEKRIVLFYSYIGQLTSEIFMVVENAFYRVYPKKYVPVFVVSNLQRCFRKTSGKCIIGKLCILVPPASTISLKHSLVLESHS